MSAPPALVVMGVRNDDLAQVSEVLTRCGFGHTSVRIRLEEVLGDPTKAWAALAHTHLTDNATLVLSNGPFWFHSGLLDAVVAWRTQGMGSLIVNLPHHINGGEDLHDRLDRLAHRHRVQRLVHLVKAPVHIPEPLRGASRPIDTLIANGWVPLSRHHG